jgi:hypothetical protein
MDENFKRQFTTLADLNNEFAKGSLNAPEVVPVTGRLINENKSADPSVPEGTAIPGSSSEIKITKTSNREPVDFEGMAQQIALDINMPNEVEFIKNNLISQGNELGKKLNAGTTGDMNKDLQIMQNNFIAIENEVKAKILNKNKPAAASGTKTFFEEYKTPLIVGGVVVLGIIIYEIAKK